MDSTTLSHIVMGFLTPCFLYGVYYACRGIHRLRKKAKHKVGKLADDISNEKDWRNSASYHKELLKLMEEGHPKKQAMDILSERRRIEILENKEKEQDSLNKKEAKAQEREAEKAAAKKQAKEREKKETAEMFHNPDLEAAEKMLAEGSWVDDEADGN